MNSFFQYKIILTGGGTAGHIWPHFALFEGEKSPLAKAFQNHQLEVHYMGSESGMEKDLVKAIQPNWFYHPISTGKLRRYFSIQNFLDTFKIVLGFFQAFFLIGKIKPSVVFSKGGFVSAPVVWAAWLRGIPIVIHESDATLALATKLTIPFARKVLVSFPETKKQVYSIFQKKVFEIGLPLRESLFSANRSDAMSYFGFTESNRKVVLIFGGSLGAKPLNKNIFEIVPELLKQYYVIHIVGKGNKEDLGVDASHYKQFEFLKDEMKYVYAVTDLAICRAGASSIFELAAASIPMILIPLGLNASRGDQIINAKIFANHGWAQWFEESDFKKEFALKQIEATMDQISEKKRMLETAPSRNASYQVSEVLWNVMLQDKNGKKI
jgi:UDP-N-acetylglucosamine--N-acetylmuramyl-(pentapeptide) pyrophosphoryl-undecaprenol N-acetylglucosamine transferase